MTGNDQTMSFSKFVNEIKVYRDNIEDKLYDISQLLANVDKIIEEINLYLKFQEDDIELCQCRMDGVEPCRIHGGA